MDHILALFGGGCRIRTRVGLPPNGFQDFSVIWTFVEIDRKHALGLEAPTARKSRWIQGNYANKSAWIQGKFELPAKG